MAGTGGDWSYLSREWQTHASLGLFFPPYTTQSRVPCLGNGPRHNKSFPIPVNNTASHQRGQPEACLLGMGPLIFESVFPLQISLRNLLSHYLPDTPTDVFSC